MAAGRHGLEEISNFLQIHFLWSPNDGNWVGVSSVGRMTNDSSLPPEAVPSTQGET